MYTKFNFVRIPDIAYARKMRERSKGLVLSVDMQDPSTTRGLAEVLKNYSPYVSVLSECKNVRRKMVINGPFEK